MFDKDFYPTPNSTIKDMIKYYDFNGKIIYDPSAGKGNIIDYLCSEFSIKEAIATEKVPELREILSSKCKLLPYDDFLLVPASAINHIDVIIMNPPFSVEEDHIIHAWNILPDGARLISLCSSPCVDNPNTAKRKTLSMIIEKFGNQKYLGQPFQDAERKTSVHVSCIWLEKPAVEKTDFNEYFDMSDDEFEEQQEGIMTYSWVRDIVSRYYSALLEFDKVIDAADSMKRIINPIDNRLNVMFGAMKRDGNYYSFISKEDFSKELLMSAWESVVDLSKARKYTTSKVLDQMNEQIKKFHNIKFTMKNVYLFQQMLIGTAAERLNDCLAVTFDWICQNSPDNHTGGEGWRTNSDYMVNKRFILPRICKYDDYGTKYETVRVHYGWYKEMDDLTKAMCFLTGKDYDKGSYVDNSLDHFCTYNNPEWGQWYQWNEFFKIRGYKKGTMHFEFVDEDVWANFNIAVAKYRGWSNQLMKQQDKTTRKSKNQEKQRSNQNKTLFD